MVFYFTIFSLIYMKKSNCKKTTSSNEVILREEK